MSSVPRARPGRGPVPATVPHADAQGSCIRDASEPSEDQTLGGPGLASRGRDSGTSVLGDPDGLSDLRASVPREVTKGGHESWDGAATEPRAGKADERAGLGGTAWSRHTQPRPAPSLTPTRKHVLTPLLLGA